MHCPHDPVQLMLKGMADSTVGTTGQLFHHAANDRPCSQRRPSSTHCGVSHLCQSHVSCWRRDPLANSFIAPLTAEPAEDTRLVVEEFERSAEDDAEFGIDHLKLHDDQGVDNK